MINLKSLKIKNKSTKPKMKIKKDIEIDAKPGEEGYERVSIKNFDIKRIFDNKFVVRDLQNPQISDYIKAINCAVFIDEDYKFLCDKIKECEISFNQWVIINAKNLIDVFTSQEDKNKKINIDTAQCIICLTEIKTKEKCVKDDSNLQQQSEDVTRVSNDAIIIRQLRQQFTQQADYQDSINQAIELASENQNTQKINADAEKKKKNDRVAVIRKKYDDWNNNNKGQIRSQIHNQNCKADNNSDFLKLYLTQARKNRNNELVEDKKQLCVESTLEPFNDHCKIVKIRCDILDNKEMLKCLYKVCKDEPWRQDKHKINQEKKCNEHFCLMFGGSEMITIKDIKIENENYKMKKMIVFWFGKQPHDKMKS